MIDQCHSEADIVNYILPYIIVINFKIFYKYEMAPAGGIRDPLGTYSSFYFFAFLCNKSLLKKQACFKERIWSQGEQNRLLSFKVDHFLKGGKNIFYRVAYPESLSILLHPCHDE